ncbi:sporulation associated protein [Streptomyces sp. NPDC048142]|uniref:sporulation associated protein n=1 Tax=Streptomyces sp. NPDC048142 TaxID=3365501 RepID=UPI003713E344
MTGRRPKTPNRALAVLLTTHGISHKGLAFRVNQLAEQHGSKTSYNHSSVARWTKGSIPQEPVPQLIARAFTERIGRTVTVEEIGMGAVADNAAVGWDFPRDRAEAITIAQAHWSASERTAGRFAVSGYSVAVTRWLGVPSDRVKWGTSAEGRQIGLADLAELRSAAEQARQWDAQFGGGNWRMSSAAQCLRNQALPLLAGSHSEKVGRELFSVTAELGRVLGWAAFDSGDSAAAQQHLVQALRLARAGGDVEMGTYILTTMALHTLLEGAPDEALDMAQGAFHQGRNHSSRRVLAFAKLAEARALGRLEDGTGATTALSRAESWLNKINTATRDPDWLGYVTPGRLAADASEIFRDLRKPIVSLTWNDQADSLCDTSAARAVGLRLAIAATAACQARDLDRAVDYAERSLSLLSRVDSARARIYLQDVASALAPWAEEQHAKDLIERLRQASNPLSAPAVAP